MRTLEFNLAELDEKTLLKMLSDNQAGLPELFSLLESLFEMWATSLKFSAAVVKYGETQSPNFLTTYAQQAGPRHGIDPARLVSLIELIKQTQRPTSSKIH
jgi:hypothetical protein